MPASIATFFGALADFTAFDIVPYTDQIYDAIFSYPYTAPVNHSFGAMGYDSTCIIKNLGSFFLFYLLFPVFLGVATLLAKCGGGKCKTAGNKV